MNSSDPNLFTAAQIGKAIGLSDRHIRRRMVGTQERLLRTSEGQVAKGWYFTDLPQKWKATLKASAAREGYRDAEDLLANAGAPWQPPVSLPDVAAENLEVAQKLQRALMATLSWRLDDSCLAKVEVERLGIEDYKREFGYSVSPRHFRRLINRTLKRDAGAKNWGRIELYLDDHVEGNAVSANPPTIEELASPFLELLEVYRGCRTPGAPTPTEEDEIWAQAMEIADAEIEAGRTESEVQWELRQFVWQHLKSFSATEEGLRKMIGRKRQTWIAKGGDAAALKDGRALRKGHSTGQPIAQSDADILIWHTGRNCSGRLSQAARELRSDPEVLGPENRASDEFIRFLEEHGGSSKSYIPHRLRRLITPEKNRLKAFHIGPRAVDKHTAAMELDYTGIPSMFAITGDDTTLPVKFAIPVENYHVLRRGQFLVFIDFRTLRILGFTLVPSEGYSSHNIYTQTTKIMGEHGKPEVAVFEQGIWKNSRLIRGDVDSQPPPGWDFGLPYSEICNGLRGLMHIVHARRARSKPVERVIGLLQDYMEREPGYCGRNEKIDCPEALKVTERELVAGRVQPGEAGIYTFGQWNDRLGEICELYNATPQEGRRLAGLSPDQAFKDLWPVNDPPMRLTPELRYFWARFQRRHRITDNGITFRIGGNSYQYVDEQTGRLRGEEVLLWFDPEVPEFITVTDMNRKNAFCVERSEKPNALERFVDPEAGTLARQSKRAQAHNAYPKARFNLLQARFKPAFRRNLVDAESLETARNISEQEAALKDRQTKRAADLARARAFAKRVGVPVTESLVQNPERIAANEEAEALFREINGKGASE